MLRSGQYEYRGGITLSLIANICRQNCLPNDISAASNKTLNPVSDLKTRCLGFLGSGLQFACFNELNETFV